MKKNTYILALGMLASLRTMACGGSTASSEPSGTGGESAGTGGGASAGACDQYAEAAGWKQGDPIVSTAVSTPERIAAIGAQTWNVALKMLNTVPSTEHANIAHSSTSFYTALSIAHYEYADSDCGPAIAEVLEFPEEGMGLHHSIGAGLRELTSRKIAETEDSDGLKLNVTNSIWAVQSDELPEPDEINSIYGATPNAVDTYGQPVRELMNCLIEEDSEGILVDFIPAPFPDVDTFYASINVTYLAAPWALGMDAGPVQFAVNGGALEEVEGIKGYGVTHPIYEGPTFRTIEIPLLGRELSVFFVVPGDDFEGTLDEFSASLTHEELITAQASAEARYIDFEMPKVDIESVTIDYKVQLPIECNPIDGIRQVFHGAGVEMDEKGIKAAAATVVFGDGDAAPEPPEESFLIDRPFLFFVHDAETGFALFSGRYQGPGL
jgi:serpin B